MKPHISQPHSPMGEDEVTRVTITPMSAQFCALCILLASSPLQSPRDRPPLHPEWPFHLMIRGLRTLSAQLQKLSLIIILCNKSKVKEIKLSKRNDQND